MTKWYPGTAASAPAGSAQHLEEVIALATRAPSSMNTQLWHLHVLTGEPLGRIQAENTEGRPIVEGKPWHRPVRRPAPAAAGGDCRAAFPGHGHRP